MTSLKRWRRSGTAAALTAVAAVLAACGGEQDPVSGRDFQDLPADQVMFDAIYDIKDMGTLRARLHSDTMYVFEDSAKTLMMPVDLKLYDANGVQTAHLTSREGELDTRTNQMVARGDVVLVTMEADRRILTEELFYDPGSHRIWSNVATVVYEDDTRLEGQGFTATEDMKNIEVFKATGENLRIEF